MEFNSNTAIFSQGYINHFVSLSEYKGYFVGATKGYNSQVFENYVGLSMTLSPSDTSLVLVNAENLDLINLPHVSTYVFKTLTGPKLDSTNSIS